MSEWAIELRGVSKVFTDGGTEFRALSDVDLTVPTGEFLLLMGPSGSGKTTLLSMIGCVLRPTEGEVRLLGEVVSSLSDRALPAVRRAFIGFVFQGHNLLAGLTCQDNVALGLEIRGIARRTARTEALALLEAVGVGGLGDRMPAQLSGGQRQRVAVARALAGHPPLLLADEPTAALDAAAGQAVTGVLADLARELGVTVVVVSHDERIHHFADRILVLEDGRIVGAKEVRP
jgi:putative ABC transport system ATP-binding protein